MRGSTDISGLSRINDSNGTARLRENAETSLVMYIDL